MARMLQHGLLALALMGCAAAAGVGVDIDPAHRAFVDKAGRQVLFHGVNVVYKVDPYVPSDGAFDPQLSLNDDDVALLKGWGMNLVRLGVMWEAVERQPGVYDDAYLDKVEALVNRLGKAGIYTLVDAHQDVFARVMCGEGIPDFYAKQLIANDPYCISKHLDWALVPVLSKLGICQSIDSYGFRKDENGDPLIADCQTKNFAMYYTTKESLAAFRGFFTNALGVQDKFVDYWDHVAARFANNSYVVGFDPFNEPFLANPLKDPRLVVPGAMDKKYLAPLYKQLYAKYQARNPTKQMWFEPVPFPDEAGVLGGFVFPVGFDAPPGGAAGSATHVLNDHTYCCQMSAGECAGGEPQVAHAAQCLKFHEKRVQQRVDDAQRLQVPFIITEFGACLTEGPCTQEINQVGDVADAHLVGWAYWQYKTYKDLTTSAGTQSEGFWNQDGTLQTFKVKALSRAYLPHTQGILTHQSFNTSSAAFSATFTYRAQAAAAPTVAYLNQELWYGPAPHVAVAVNGAAAAVAGAFSGNYYTFDVSAVAKDGDTVVVTAVKQPAAGGY